MFNHLKTQDLLGFRSCVKIEPQENHLPCLLNQTRWIRASNYIEDVGPDWTETCDLLRGKEIKVSEFDKRAVLNTRNLLNVVKPEFDPDQLKQWHQQLFQGMDMDSELRTRNVSTLTEHGRHHYPPHQEVKQQLSLFCGLVHTANLASGTDLLSRLALAAFIQYHFLSLHPFVDGNGRLSRVLSQGCLDGVYPTFEKDEYFQALQKGRELAPDKAPGPLLELMVKDLVQQGKAQTYAMAWMKTIKEDHDDDGYWVQSEAEGMCIIWGETPEEARFNALNALVEMGEVLLENNYPLKTVTKIN